MRPSTIRTQVRQAIRAGSPPDDVGALAARLGSELAVEQVEKLAKAKARARGRRDRGVDGTLDLVLRSTRALLNRLDDDPKGVGTATTRIIAEVGEVQDEVARRMRASGQYSMTEIADVLGVTRKTAYNRWGQYPGGLPSGGQVASRR